VISSPFKNMRTFGSSTNKIFRGYLCSGPKFRMQMPFETSTTFTSKYDYQKELPAADKTLIAVVSDGAFEQVSLGFKRCCSSCVDCDGVKFE